MTHAASSRILALMAAGLLTATGAAHADTATSGNGSIGGGNQIGADVDAPVNVCGNSVAVLGAAGAQCVDGGAGVGGAPARDGGSERTPADRGTGHDGYDGYYDDEDRPEESPDGNPREETPDEDEEPREGTPDDGGTPEESPSPTPEDEESPATTEENRSEVSEEASAPPQERVGAPSHEASVPTSGNPQLAVTGGDGTGVLWMVAAALATAAAGAGLILLGLRRRARA
ncbi:chaplin [Nocardiopsis sp. NPDC049922]|uniref:chaplin n=1 Tax=Nocardiopsis sp. NPDC049922 TaxID=3155157 RepID=UPI00340D6A5C